MFQLLLPGIRSKTSGGRGTRRKKIRLFGKNKYMPCVYCKQTLSFDEATIEHIVPQWQGGIRESHNQLPEM